MPNFSEDIQKFQRNGTYTYKYDNVGNLIFDNTSNDFSHVYLSLPLQNFGYDTQKIKSFYNTEFEEFVSLNKETIETSENLQQELNVIKSENDRLKQQLDNIITDSETNQGEAQMSATKQVILELRKSLGQGRVNSDFSEDFPYTPIRKDILE